MGKNNLKEEKAKRNKEYALKFKKTRRSGGRGPRGPRFSEGTGGEGGAPNMAPRPRTTTMFTAVCSACGSEAKLPFEPTSGKPVFCDSCFQKQPR